MVSGGQLRQNRSGRGAAVHLGVCPPKWGQRHPLAADSVWSMRTRVLIALAGLALALTACAPEVTENTTEPSPSSAAPVPTETSAATPEADASDDLTPAVLADLCVEKTREFYRPDAEFFTEDARIEQRKVDPPWLVMVPSISNGVDSASVCTIGGTASSPIFEAFAAGNPLTDQEIQDAIDGVEYYTGD